MNFTKQVKSTIIENEFYSSEEYYAFVIGFLSSTGYIYSNMARGVFSDKDEYIMDKGDRLRTDDFYFHPKYDEKGNYEYMDYIGNIDIERFFDECSYDACRAYLQGAFLATGSVSDPKKAYHLELQMGNESEANRVKRVLSSMQVNSKILERESYFVVYVKDGEEISDILTLLGCISETLYFEEQMVVKSARNNINRKVNCETANLSKTISAGVKQIAAIEKLKETGKFELLDEGLYEVAILRLANPDATLKELAMLYGGGITKSGINHRLKRLIELAEE